MRIGQFFLLLPVVILLGIMTPRYANAQSVNITGISDSFLCTGDSVRVNYSIISAFNPGNTLSVLLSDSSGSFVLPVTIGSRNAVSGSSFIDCVIPQFILTGTNYRIRLLSSAPVGLSAIYSGKLDITRTPTPVAVTNGPICQGDSLKLMDTDTLTTGATYTWTGGSFAFFVKNPVIPNATTGMSGVYVLKATIGACAGQSQVTALVKPVPVKPLINATNPACTGDVLSLSLPGGTTGQVDWLGPAGFSDTGISTFILNTTLANAGQYTAIVTINGCSASDTQNVVVNPSPSKPEAKLVDTLVCSSRQMAFTAASITPGVTYNWTGPFSSTLQNPVFNPVTLLHSGSYIVSATIGGCSSYDTLQVLVNPTPSIPVVSYVGACTGDTLRLVANSNIGTGPYTWYDTASTYSNVSFDGIALRTNASLSYNSVYGAYRVSTSGCISDTAYLPVTINTKPATPVITNNNPTVCAGKSFALSAFSSTTGVSYSWSGPSGFSTSGAALFNPSADTSETGVYTVTAIAATCSSSIATTIDVIPTVTPAVAISATPDVEVSKMTLLTFKAIAFNAGENPQYQWLRNGVEIPGATDTIYKAKAGVDVNDGELVSVLLKSDVACPLPDSIASYVFTVAIRADITDANVPNELTIYPNPNNGQFKIKGTVNTANPVGAKLMDISGKVVYSEMITPVSKTLDHPVNTGNIAPGVYMLQVKIDEQFMNLRFVID